MSTDLKERAKEPTTYGGIAILLTLFDLNVSEEQVGQAVELLNKALIGISGLAAMFMGERGTSATERKD